MEIAPCFIPLHEKLSFLFDLALKKGIFPGAAVGVVGGSPGQRKKYIVTFGHRALVPEVKQLDQEVFFDLASLTKPLATTLAVLSLIKEKKIRLDDGLDDLLEREVPEKKRKITLFHLLNHCSGLAAHRHFYKELIHFPKDRREEILLSRILAEPFEYETGTGAIYSDLGFMLLGRMIEIKARKKLDQYVENRILMPLDLEKDLFFNTLDGKKEKKYAATENCPWRKKIISGEVHDQNSYAIGGVSGQAGLFGTINGVLSLVSMLHDIYQGWTSHPYFKKEDLKKFFRKQNLVKNSSWGLGFDTPSKKGSSGGKFISEKSVGHLGFTGTSFWIDPQKQLVMVLLTNRIHPRIKEGIKTFRPLFHDAVISSLCSG